MNNSGVERLLLDTEQEIEEIKLIVHAQGIFHKTTPYLTRYAVIKASGALEQAFKSIVADFCITSHMQLNNFIEKKVRKNSMNPSFDNMIRMLKDFDDNWVVTFKEGVNREADHKKIKSHVESLSVARNTFAHGGNPTTSIDAVEAYYRAGMKLVSVFDFVVC